MGHYENNRTGFAHLARRLAKTHPQPDAGYIHLVVEPTGGYELPLVAFAFGQGWRVSLPNPKQVRDGAKGMGGRAKNDPLDNRTLAWFGAVCQPDPQHQLPPAVAALDTLLRRRADLEAMRRPEKNRRQTLDYKPHASQATKASVTRLIAILEEERQQVAAAIKALLDPHPPLKTQAQPLRTAPGIGPKTVLPILVFFYRWQARTAGQGTSKGGVALPVLTPRKTAAVIRSTDPPRFPRWGVPLPATPWTWPPRAGFGRVPVRSVTSMTGCAVGAKLIG